MSTHKPSLLTEEDRKLLLKVHKLLEEVLETIEILENKETMKAIEEAEKNIRKGEVRNYKEFIEELEKTHEI